MSAEIKQWLDGFAEHLNFMCEKFGSQSAYCKHTTITSHNMSQIINKRFAEFSKQMILLMAERAGYDKENHRHMCAVFTKLDNAEWKTIKTEVATQFESTRTENNAMSFQSQTAETPRTSTPQDLYLIERYRSMRNTLPIAKADQPVIRKALLHNLCEDLKKLDERELC